MVYEIKNEDLCVKISSLGAELQSIIKNGAEYLWQGDPAYWAKRAAVLFPVVGRCLDGKIEAEGGDYPMPQHGFVKNMEFELSELSETSCTLCLCSNEETKTHYPYDFKFSVTYTLSGSSIINSFRVDNTGSKTLYYTIGGHPGFRCPAGHGAFEDWELIFEHDEPLYSTPVTPEGVIVNAKSNADRIKISSSGRIPLSRSLFVPDAMIFENLSSRKITLRHKADKIGVTMDYSDFPIIAVWTLPKDGADYVCLEPWCGMAHIEGESAALRDKLGVMPIEAGQSSVKSFTLEIF